MSILLSMHEPWHYSNWEPVLRHMSADEVQLVVSPWSHRGEDAVVQERAMAQTGHWLDQRGLSWVDYREAAEPHVLGTLAIDPRAVPNQYCRQVRMLYAVISKQYTYSELNRTYDAVMVASSFGRDLLARQGVRATVVGYPKLDDVFNGVLTREAARAQFGLDADRRLVLYAPTFGDMCTVERFATAFDELDPDVDLLVQLHPVSYVGELARFGVLGERFQWVPEELAGLAALVAADVVVTDYSGVIFEACAADIPIVLLDDPEMAPTEDVERVYRDAGVRISDPAELRGAIEGLLGDPSQGADRRTHYREWFFEYRGNAGEQAAEALRGFVEEARLARRQDADHLYRRLRELEAARS